MSKAIWVSQWPPSLSLHVKSGLLTIGFLFSKNQRPDATVLVSLGIVYPVGSVPALVQADTSQPAPTRQKAIHHSKVRIWMTDSEERGREKRENKRVNQRAAAAVAAAAAAEFVFRWSLLIVVRLLGRGGRVGKGETKNTVVF